MENKEKVKKWDFKCVTDVSNWGMVLVQKGRILNKKGLVELEGGRKTTLKRIKSFFIDPKNEASLWAEYNPKMKWWRKRNNLVYL